MYVCVSRPLCVNLGESSDEMWSRILENGWTIGLAVFPLGAFRVFEGDQYDVDDYSDTDF